MKTKIMLCAVMLSACTPSAPPVQQRITQPGLSIPGPYENSPVLIKNLDSQSRPSGGIYLRPSDHSAEMIKNISNQNH